ncbi:hypothetical protein ACI65C_011427 [Semiaphis heraclei]
MLKKETGYLCLFWNDILQHCNKVSIDLQSKSNDILKAVNLLKSLKNVVSSLRDSNMVYERRVGEFCSQISIMYKDENKRKIIKKFPDGNNKTLTALSGIDKFRVETHHVIVDKFCSELDKRINAYSVVVENFLFLTRLHVESTIDVEESVNKFISVYKDDVDDSIKICKILKLKSNRYLLLLSSSYVIIVFSTKTLTNSLELALVSLLLWKVVDSMSVSDKVIAAENEIRNKYAYCTSITDKVVMSRKLRLLPSHHFSHCLEIGTILAVGTFNGLLTFLLFAVTPLFDWISRGFSKNIDHFVKIFNVHFIVLFLCTQPGIFVFILIDSFYYKHITENKASLVITPLNFIKYNIKPSNLDEHSTHFQMTHAIINIPLLFNVLTLLFLGRLQFKSLIKIVLNHHYHVLPNVYELNTLMMANVIIPLFLLSILPHQEPRFLLPLLLPIVFSISKNQRHIKVYDLGSSLDPDELMNCMTL